MTPVLRLAFRILAPAAVAAAVLVPASPALAHAEMEACLPAHQATTSSPATLAVRFTKPVRPVEDSIVLSGPNGRVAQLGDAVATDSVTLKAPVKGELPDGSYTVDWRAQGDDGHVLEGTWAFTVKAPAAKPAAKAAAPVQQKTVRTVAAPAPVAAAPASAVVPAEAVAAVAENNAEIARLQETVRQLAEQQKAAQAQAAADRAAAEQAASEVVALPAALPASSPAASVLPVGLALAAAAGSMLLAGALRRRPARVQEQP